MDALRPNMLGPYGNTWFDTPAMNQFAARSTVFEHCLADTPDPLTGFANLISGRHFCQTAPTPATLMELADSAKTLLVTTDPNILSDRYDQFDQVIEVELPLAEELASDIETTQLATFFATAIQEISKADSNSQIILYCDFLARVWDAPYDLRERLADDDDPEPSRVSCAANQQFNETVDDPDLLLDFQIAYGAQVIVFDNLFDIFRQQIAANSELRNSLLALTALRGYPLGEHGVVGFYRDQLFNESLHVPLMICLPNATNVGRSQRLVQPGSLFELYADWHRQSYTSAFPKLMVDNLRPDYRSSAVVSGMVSDSQSHHSIQTQSWKLIAGNSRQLFVRPDDLWEYNDVSDLCSEVVNELESALGTAIEQLASGHAIDLELSTELAFGIE